MNMDKLLERAKQLQFEETAETLPVAVARIQDMAMMYKYCGGVNNCLRALSLEMLANDIEVICNG